MSLTNCIITGIPITENNDPQLTIEDNHYVYWYGMNINGERFAINVCRSLMDNYNWEGEIKSGLEENRILIVGEFLNGDLARYNYKTYHWNCDLKGRKNHINLKGLIEEIKKKTDYPKT